MVAHSGLVTSRRQSHPTLLKYQSSKRSLADVAEIAVMGTGDDGLEVTIIPGSIDAGAGLARSKL